MLPSGVSRRKQDMKFIRKIIWLFMVVTIHSQTHASFEVLPQPLKQMVFSYGNFNVQDLGSCACVSKEFRTLADSDGAWRHLLPDYQEEIIGLLLLKGGSSVRALYLGLPNAPSIKAQYRMYGIMPLHKETLKADIHDVVFRVYYKSLKVSSFKVYEELLLFAELFGSPMMGTYFNQQEEPYWDKFTSSYEVSKNACESLNRIYSRYIKRGSLIAIERQVDLDKTMQILKQK
jgi:hypothetical protein